jgi:hypothetical protein
MSDPGQDKDAGPREAERCTPEELFEHGGPVFQLFAELVEGACKASGIPGYAIIALAPNGGMASINGGSDEEARTLCGQLALEAGNELVRRIRAADADRERPN